MKILSKYKDYYDYLMGIYGEDPLLILDRREGRQLSFCDNHNYMLNLHIGGYEIQGFSPGREDRPDIPAKVYWGENLRLLDEYDSLLPNYRSARILTKEKSWDWDRHKHFHHKEQFDRLFMHRNINREDYTIINLEKEVEDDCIFLHTLRKSSNSLNDIYNCPIVITDSQRETKNVWLFPSLESANINTFLTPGEAYKLISDWLSLQRTLAENKPTIMTNNQKIESKGFDKVTSFRPNMK